MSRNRNQRVHLSLIFFIFLSLIFHHGLFSIGTQQQRDPLHHPRAKATFLPESWWISVHSRSVYSYGQHVMKPPVRREGFGMSALWTFCPAPRHLFLSGTLWTVMWPRKYSPSLSTTKTDFNKWLLKVEVKPWQPPTIPEDMLSFTLILCIKSSWYYVNVQFDSSS